MAKTNELQKKDQNEQLAASQRFTDKVMMEFGNNTDGEIRVSEFQKQLIQGYFISIDKALKSAELKRNDAKQALPYTWNNVNLDTLALDCVHYARIGLDMQTKNHLFPIPYKDKHTGKYNITFMPGYNGIKYIAEKYGVNKPKSVTVELVYSNDHFKPYKKGKDIPFDTYEFDIVDAFDRGELRGGFAYVEYEESSRNNLIIMSKADILKRKPQYAAKEFWDGWTDEMYRKTIIREAYSEKYVPIDPQKVDENYQHMKMQEIKFAQLAAQADVDDNANIIDITPEEVPTQELPPAEGKPTGADF